MRAKRNKATKLSTTPQPRIQLPPLNSILQTNAINLGLTKSWLRRCNGSGDQLRLCPQLHHLDDNSSLYNPLDSTHYRQYSVVGVTTNRIFPSKNAKIPLKFSLLSPYQLINTSCITRLQLSGGASPILFTYRLNQEKDHGPYTRIYEFTLIKYECNALDPFDAEKKCMQFTSLVKFEGIVFALSLQGALAIIQEIDSCLTIAAISSFRAVPSISSRYFKEYLFALDGEIMLVFLIHEKSVRVVDKVEVFRLCFPDLKWIKVERIQGKKTLFFGQCYLEVHSAETGARRNCIYFRDHGSDNKWWIYDMETSCISPA